MTDEKSNATDTVERADNAFNGNVVHSTPRQEQMTKGGIVLVPQPSDNPADPLVRPQSCEFSSRLPFLTRMLQTLLKHLNILQAREILPLTVSAELACVEKNHDPGHHIPCLHVRHAFSACQLLWVI